MLKAGFIREVAEAHPGGLGRFGRHEGGAGTLPERSEAPGGDFTE